MTDRRDDLRAVAVAHDSLIARALAASASTIVRAWNTSAVHRRMQLAQAAFCALTPADRLRYGLIVVATALVTRLLLPL